MESRQILDRPAVLITVGTSLITNYQKENPGSQPGISQLVEFLTHHENLPNAGSGEVQTLRGLGLDPEAVHYFLATDEPDGILAATGLCQYVKSKGISAEVIAIKDLCKNFLIFQTKGLPNLINKMMDILEWHNFKAKIVATGGLKAETTYAALVGVLNGVPVFYIHEDFSNVIQFPPLPLVYNHLNYGDFLAFVELLPKQEDATQSQKLLQERLSPQLQSLFWIDPDTNRLTLTPMGNLLWRILKLKGNKTTLDQK